MTTPSGHDDLTRLFHAAVDDVEPREGLPAIRSAIRTASTKESPMNTSRTWLLGALGGAVATAAVVGGVVLATSGDDPRGKDEIPPLDSPSQSVTDGATTSPSPSATPSGAPSPSGSAVPPLQSFSGLPAYYVASTDHGPRLYREFGSGQGTSKTHAAVVMAVDGDAADPDYRSGWPSSVAVRGVSATDDLITVDLTGVPRERVGGMSVAEADAAIEQVIFTAQAAYGAGRVPVQLLLDGQHTDRMLGQPTSEGLAAGGILETLSHVNLNIAEGVVVSDGSLEVSGVGNSFEANIGLKLVQGSRVAWQGYATAGSYEDKLFPFSTVVDVSGLAPGTYTLVASTDDPSGGAEGNGPHTDTKTVVIR